MPWSRLRVYRPSDPGDAPYSHSAFNSSQLEKHSEQALHHDSDAVRSSSRQPDESVPLVVDPTEQMDATEQTLMSSRSHSPVMQDPHLRPQRFSMLKFRHASDSQLSRTAKTQSMAHTSPAPSGESC